MERRHDARLTCAIARRLKANAYTFNDPQTPARPPDSSKLEFRLEPQTKILRKEKECLAML